MAFARAYRRLYAKICGAPPDLRPWHSQWLAAHIIHRPLQAALAEVRGDVLDVGCESKPYERWATGANRYVGIDVVPGPKVDVVIRPSERWPLQDASFDVVLCTQVLEHAADLAHLLQEMTRVLRPGGSAIVTAPFLYNQHHPKHDYRRFTRRGLEQELSRHLSVVEVTSQGGVGSSLGVILLNWVELSMTQSRRRVGIFALCLPVWVALSAVVNLAGWLLDRIDRTSACYGNVMVRAVKP